MSNLLATLVSSSRALRVYDRVLDVTQNNVANASTPGYVRQNLPLEALPFDNGEGALGGVWAGDMESARNEYAEAAVRQRTTELGQDSQMVESLTALEAVVGSTGSTGIAGALSQFYRSASGWSVSPNDPNARDEFLTRAGDVATAFRQTAAAVAQVTSDAENQLRETVSAINSLAGQIQDCNRRIRAGARDDPAVDAGIHSALEELSQYVDFTALRQEDGSFTVLAGGQTPLVVGDHRYDLTFSMEGSANGTASAVVSSAAGVDVTTHMTTGRLGALLDFRNRVLGGITGGADQTGSLNLLAEGFANRVNDILSAGIVSEGPPQVAGSALFTYDGASSANAASTLELDPAVTASGLPAIDPGPPYVSNGVPLRLSNLASPSDAADKLDTFTFTEYYGRIGSRVGRALDDATTGEQTRQSLVAQAKDLRDQSSGVSLDEEAVVLMQFQRSYQAMSRLIQLLDDLSQEAINILR
jgi:flagellar hook-associated protein 1